MSDKQSTDKKSETPRVDEWENDRLEVRMAAGVNLSGDLKGAIALARQLERELAAMTERMNDWRATCSKMSLESALSANTPFQQIAAEVERARTKHPTWPANDTLFAAAIVSEESGELMRAAVQHRGEGGSLEACDKEAIQTAATCIRFLERR